MTTTVQGQRAARAYRPCVIKGLNSPSDAVILGVLEVVVTAKHRAARLPSLVRALILLEPGLSYVLDSGLQSFPETHDWHTWLNHTLTSTHSLEEIMARCKEYAPDNDEAATLSFAQMVHNLDPLLEENILNDQLFKDYKPEQLPRGELATLKGLDHFAPWEAPDIVAQTTVEFIDRVVTAESDVGPTM